MGLFEYFNVKKEETQCYHCFGEGCFKCVGYRIDKIFTEDERIGMMEFKKQKIRENIAKNIMLEEFNGGRGTTLPFPKDRENYCVLNMTKRIDKNKMETLINSQYDFNESLYTLPTPSDE